LSKRMVMLVGLVVILIIPVPAWVLAQTIGANDDTTLKQIIVFGRHSIRSATTDTTELSIKYSVDPYPPFEVAAGCLTPNGRKAETLLGAYYRQYLLHERLLTGNNRTDAAQSYFRSNSIERSFETAAAFQSALIPNSTESVHSFPINPSSQTDPVFDPIKAGVAKVDQARAANQVQEMFYSGSALSHTVSGEYSLIRSVLFDYPLGTRPAPPAPPHKADPTSQAITLTPTNIQAAGEIINIGGLHSTIDAADPFVMQYADGFNMNDVGWGRLTPDQISQQTRIVNLEFEIEMRSPYLDQVQSSNAASHVLRTMQQAVFGYSVPGAFGDAASRVVVVISSDAYVAGLAGLLNMHWQLPGYQPDFCAPGGALVFELRQSKSSNQYFVRVFYTAQTFDQLRHLTPLSLANPPATMQLFVPDGSQSALPGGGKAAGDLDVNFSAFQSLLTNAINPAYVQNPRQEVHPGVLSGVYCQ